MVHSSCLDRYITGNDNVAASENDFSCLLRDIVSIWITVEKKKSIRNPSIFLTFFQVPCMAACTVYSAAGVNCLLLLQQDALVWGRKDPSCTPCMGWSALFTRSFIFSVLVFFSLRDLYTAIVTHKPNISAFESHLYLGFLSSPHSVLYIFLCL